MCSRNLTVYDKEDPSETSVWIRNSASTLWGAPVGDPEEGALMVTPESGVAFKEDPVISPDGCTVTAILTGYSYEVNALIDGTEIDPPLTIPDDVEGTSFSLSILAEGPGSVVDNEEIIEEQELEIYPNPAGDLAMIEFSLTERSKVKVGLYDLNGNLAIERVWNSRHAGRNRVEIPVFSLPSGMYLIRLSSTSDFFTGKIIKQ